MDRLQTAIDRLEKQQQETADQVGLLAQGTPEPLAGGPSYDLQTELNLIQDRLDALDSQNRALDRHIQQTTERVGGLAYDLRRLERRSEQKEIRSAGPETQASPPAPAGVLDARGIQIPAAGSSGLSLPQSTRPQDRTDEPGKLFQKAYADYTRGDYDLAVLGFTTVLNMGSTGPLADDAVYYLAEIASARGQVEQALAGYARVEREFSDSDKIPAAILKRGLLLLDANRIGEGVVQLDHLVKSYPESDEARLARNKLRALGVGP
ncbi:MAG: tol-pal system YbgF family protein [Acidobacteriota bacterium]